MHIFTYVIHLNHSDAKRNKGGYEELKKVQKVQLERTDLILRIDGQ